MTKLFILIFGAITALAVYLTVINFGMVDDQMPGSARDGSAMNHRYHAK